MSIALAKACTELWAKDSLRVPFVARNVMSDDTYAYLSNRDPEWLQTTGRDKAAVIERYVRVVDVS